MDVTPREPRRNWFGRNTTNLVVLGCVLLIGVMQWPALKGILYRVTGTAPKDNIAWRQDYAAALVEAKASGKPLLLDFTASWCPPCQIMKHETWPDKEVEALANGRFIPVYIDIDQEQMAANRFDVSTIPTIVALTPEGRVLNRTGFVSASELVDFMNDSLARPTVRAAALP